MKRIRLATAEEIESIKDKSDLDVGCNVFALDIGKGTGFAIRRVCTEINPMISPESWDLRPRLMFIRDLETVMAAQGATHYYFNVAAEDVEWQENVKHWGAEQVSESLELRFKKIL